MVLARQRYQRMAWHAGLGRGRNSRRSSGIAVHAVASEAALAGRGATVTQMLPFGLGAWIFIAVYLLSMIGIGWLAYGARRENSLTDFYLAGRGFGVTILLMTLFATQYSGNTFYGFSGMTYRIGYAWIMSLHFMTAIVICYLLLAPGLHRLAVERCYVTPADYLSDRFRSKSITIIGTVVMIVALSNFLLAQLMAMGRAMEGFASTRPDQAYAWGVLTLALIMVIYGTLGGLRAVAWTDAIQGAVMLTGFIIVFFMLFSQYGSLDTATRLILNSNSLETARKAMPPDLHRCVEWLSYVLMIGFGAALYPQAIQRIYSARSTRVLRRSLAVMVFLPLPTQIMALTIGVMAIAYLPGLEGASSDAVLSRILSDVQQSSGFGYALVVVLMAAILAAMMSTADSALLSISSMLTNDLYRPLLRPRATQAELTLVGKSCSWILIGVLIALAIALRERASLVRLLDRKFDILIQLVPAFFAGLHWSRLRSVPVLLGLVSGLVTSLVLAFGGFDFVPRGKVFGMLHPGLIGLALNLGIAVVGSLAISGRDREAAERDA